MSLGLAGVLFASYLPYGVRVSVGIMIIADGRRIDGGWLGVPIWVWLAAVLRMVALPVAGHYLPLPHVMTDRIIGFVVMVANRIGGGVEQIG
jgi:hypothetical protein